ncbi:hypothetical protein CCACVL1_13110 [Corchorus capsularis]|uniref:Uncharacterized protein n=1 Tax=Corchorus capsularis TaxID=210143 RepID=A0A1R3ICA6_COCAP|nr:hypothetical protein CCACVL1_13110 [Corchorus capsularis]
MQQCSSPFMDSSNVDFEFDIRIDSIDKESYSSAEELFCNGKILPREMKKKINDIPSSKQELIITQKQKPQPQAKITASSSKDIKKMNEEETNNNNNNQNRSNGSSSKSSFWRFKRSSSLNNFVTGNKKKLCSNSSLSRSSSEGSVPKVKPFLQSSTNYTQKSNLKKNTINPILNVPLVDFSCLYELTKMSK